VDLEWSNIWNTAWLSHGDHIVYFILGLLLPATLRYLHFIAI